mgnify:CR=1 FL=1
MHYLARGADNRRAIAHSALAYLLGKALVYTLAGVAVIFREQLQLHGQMAFLGSLAVVVGAFAAAYASVLTKAKGQAEHPASFVFGQMLVGHIPLWVVGLATEGNPLQVRWTWNAVICVLYLAVVGSIVAFWLYYWLLNRIESTKAMMISLVTPLLAVIIGAVFLGEKLPPQTFFGGMLILSSIGLIVFRKATKEILRRDLEKT